MNAMLANSGNARSLSKYERLIAAAKAVPAAATIVVHPCDETSLRGGIESATAGMIGPTLVGPEGKIKETARDYSLTSPDSRSSTLRTSNLRPQRASSSSMPAKGEMLMKGSLHTDEFMRALPLR